MRASNVGRILTLLFACFLLLVIFAANLGIAGRFFSRVYNFPYGDKIAHFGLFGMLGLLAGLGFSAYRAQMFGVSSLISSLVLAVLIVLEEVSQIAIARRSFELSDMAAGLVGTFLFGEIGAWLARKFQRAEH